MRPGRIAFVALLLAASLLAPAGSALAESDSAVVATVGNQKLTAGEVQRRLRRVPSFQLKTYGKTPDEIRKNFVEKVMIPEVLYAEEARRRKLQDNPKVAARIRGVLRSAMMKALKAEVEKKHPVQPEDIRIYYRAHEKQFDTPKRIRIWRILVAQRSTAEHIIQQVQGTQGVKRWGQIARVQSLDEATALRNGNLGFIFPDGQTSAPRVRVHPSLYAAAAKVQDGQVVPQPVKEGKRWAVVWRRGSMPAVKRSVKDETPSIRQVLERKRVEDAMNALFTKLEDKYVHDRNDKLLQYVDVSDLGNVGARTRPGLLRRRPPRGSAAPQETEHGLR